MALAVDSFHFLAREIIDATTGIRDGLAVVGALYASRKCLGVLQDVYKVLRMIIYTKYGAKDLVRRYGKWAIVTGSTHGIGKAYAFELASNGMNIILISRGMNKLQEVASEIESMFGVETLIIPVDFNNGNPVYPFIAEKIQDKEIGILVNNVGVMYDYPQFFLDVPDERLWQLVNVNVAAATMMTQLVLPQMAERKKGIVVNMSSSSCYFPTPQMTVYSATKAYLNYFSKALHEEYKSKGVMIQCLMPWYVATRMTQYSETLSNPSILIPSAAVYARHAVASLGYSSNTTGYWPHSVLTWFSGFVPEWLWMWFAMRLNNALRKQAHIRLKKLKALKHAPSMSSVSDEDAIKQD